MNFPDTPVCEMPFFRGDLRDSNHCAFSKSTCIYPLFEPLRYSCIRLIVMFICVAMITCPKSLRFSQYTFLRSYLTLPSCAYFDFLGTHTSRLKLTPVHIPILVLQRKNNRAYPSDMIYDTCTLDFLFRNLCLHKSCSYVWGQIQSSRRFYRKIDHLA